MNGISLTGVVRELRRRRTFRTAGLYIVGAWLVMQAADVFFPAWGLPEAAINVLLVSAILGFPLALIFGWFYDITADGIVRTPVAGGSDEHTNLPLQRRDYILLASMGLIAAYLVYDGIQDIAHAPTASVTQDLGDRDVPRKLDHSVAVLPFANTSNDPGNEAFCDGIAEEILHRLSNYAELHVIGRTSSFAFKGTDYRVPKIAALLGVRYLLQGSVRRDGNSLRILASLVDETGEQRWSSSFDRELESVFAVQAEIADVVATTVVPQIVPAQTSKYEPDLAAYQQYLVGRDLLWKRDMGAADALARATELDPNYADAYAELAIALLINIADVERGRAALDRALSLQPDLPRALAAQGLWLTTQIPPDYPAAERFFREALDRDPGMVDAMNWLSNVLSAQGKYAESDDVLTRAVRIDPLHGSVASNAAMRYADRGDFARAEQTLLRLLEIPEPRRFVFLSLRELYLDTGQLVKMNDVEKRVALKGLNVYYGLSLNYAVLGLWDAAEQWVRFSREDFPDFPWVPFYPSLLPYWQGRYADAANVFRRNEQAMERVRSFAPFLYGEVQALAGDYEGAIATLGPLLAATGASADNEYERIGQQALAWAYRQTGRNDEAMALLDALEQGFEAKQARGQLNRSGDLFAYAQNALLRGDLEQALDRLERAVDAGWRQYVIQRHDPRWQVLHDHPRYIALMQRVLADVERQRVEVERIDAEGDFLARFESARQLRR